MSLRAIVCAFLMLGCHANKKELIKHIREVSKSQTERELITRFDRAFADDFLKWHKELKNEECSISKTPILEAIKQEDSIVLDDCGNPYVKEDIHGWLDGTYKNPFNPSETMIHEDLFDYNEKLLSNLQNHLTSESEKSQSPPPKPQPVEQEFKTPETDEELEPYIYCDDYHGKKPTRKKGKHRWDPTRQPRKRCLSRSERRFPPISPTDRNVRGVSVFSPLAIDKIECDESDKYRFQTAMTDANEYQIRRGVVNGNPKRPTRPMRRKHHFSVPRYLEMPPKPELSLSAMELLAPPRTLKRDFSPEAPPAAVTPITGNSPQRSRSSTPELGQKLKRRRERKRKRSRTRSYDRAYYTDSSERTGSTPIASCLRSCFDSMIGRCFKKRKLSHGDERY